MKKKVISHKNLPTKSPVFAILLVWLPLDHWNAPVWLYGVFGTIGVIAIIGFVVSVNSEEKIDVFEADQSNGKSTFQERIQKLKNK